MTTIKDSLRDDVHKDPRELEHEADRARADIERTIDALRNRLSPGEMVDHALRVARQNGGEFGSNLAMRVRENPLPMVLAGVGIAWLMASGRSRGIPDDFTERSTTGPSAGDRVASAASSAKDALHGARSAAGKAASAASRASSGISGAARTTAQSVSHATRASAHGIQDGYSYISREQPLILGALAVAAGAAIACLLPATRAEGEWLGRASEDVTGRLREAGRQAMDSMRADTADESDWSGSPSGYETSERYDPAVGRDNGIRQSRDSGAHPGGDGGYQRG